MTTLCQIIEEELIFPCGRPPKHRSPPLSTDKSSYSPSASSSSVPSAGISPNGLKSAGSKTVLTQIPESCSNASPEGSVCPSFEPRDHSRLKAAWEAMLESRFLPLQLLTVLPFYLSSVFTNVQSHPSLQIPLPPNSHCRSSDGPKIETIDPDIFFDNFSAARSSTQFDDDSLFYSPLKTSQRTIPSWAPMHLAKTVQTISECKRAIWVEYDKLYHNDPALPRVTRTSRQKDMPGMMRKTTRDEFEEAWSNWQQYVIQLLIIWSILTPNRSDMTDRIGARGIVHSDFLWGVPPGERPDWRIWKDSQTSKASTPSDAPELCRTLRGFICWKPS
jgi:hypothetical protein